MKASSLSLCLLALAGCARSTTDDKPAVTVERASLTQPPPANEWTTLTTATWPVDANIMLLTDGSVMGFGSDGKVYKMAPSATGTYDASAWTSLAAMHDPRLYFGSHVLPDGRVFVVGGEYYSGRGKGELYDPVANTWTTPFDAHGAADTETALQADGNIYIAWTSEIYNPTTNLVTTGTAYPGGGFDEAGFVLLPDQTFLTIPINSTAAYRYVPAQGKFIAAGTVPTGGLYDSGSEIGPGIRLANGKVFWVGANGKTALYTPGATSADPGSWSAGPDIPDSMKADDAPAAVLPDGKVLLLGDKGAYTGPGGIYVYDPATNMMAASPGAPVPGVAYTCRMLVLPTGQILVSTGSAGYLYTSANSYDPSWRPTITNVLDKTGGVYELDGTQLYGFSEGASYGDDAEMSTNFPLVRFEGPGANVTYARTFGWAPAMVGLGTAAQKTQFKLPTLADGTYNLVAVVNGIPSLPMSITVSGGKLVVNDFSLDMPSAVNVRQGGMATVTLKTTKIVGMGENVTLTTTAQPTGITTSYNPATITSDNGTTTITISAAVTAALGAATFTVKAQGSSAAHTRDISINVQPPPDMAVPPDMAIPNDLSTPNDLAEPNDLSQGNGGGGGGGGGGGTGGNGGGGGGDGGGKGCSCAVGGSSSSGTGGAAAAMLLFVTIGLRARGRSRRRT